MKRIIVAAALCAAFCCGAAEPGTGEAGKKSASRENFLRKTGGRIVKPGSRQGVIVFADAQDRIAATNFTALAASLAGSTGYDIRYVKVAAGTKPQDVCGAQEANLAVVAVDDAESPTLVVAPEDGWAAINVAKTAKGLMTEAARAKFHASRTRKEMLRAYSLLCGGGSSQFPGNAMNCAKQTDLDLCGEQIPYDLASNHKRYLAELGVTPIVTVPYSKACREGWAPAPTNDVQKAIWDKVHEMPSAPIKIKPETKKVKE